MPWSSGPTASSDAEAGAVPSCDFRNLVAGEDAVGEKSLDQRQDRGVVGAHEGLGHALQAAKVRLDHLGQCRVLTQQYRGVFLADDRLSVSPSPRLA